MKIFYLSLFLLITSFIAAQESLPYKNSKLSLEKRVDDLLQRMTLEEKIDLLGGTGFATKPIKRLGIPELRMSGGPDISKHQRQVILFSVHLRTMVPGYTLETNLL